MRTRECTGDGLKWELQRIAEKTSKGRCSSENIYKRGSLYLFGMAKIKGMITLCVGESNREEDVGRDDSHEQSVVQRRIFGFEPRKLVIIT
jgi:hypothetical protein